MDTSVNEFEASFFRDSYFSLPTEVGGRTRSVENLAYTPEMEAVRDAYNGLFDRQASTREVWLKLSNARKKKVLSQADRPPSSETTRIET